MPAIKLNELEQAALFGLPHTSIAIYLMALRTRMDFATGIVGGVRANVSWRAVCEWVYVEPSPGVSRGSLSVSAARRAVDWLIRSGLVEMRSNRANAQLIFHLKLASTGNFVSKKADSKPTGKADRVLHRGNAGQADRGNDAQADKHQVSGSFDNRSTTTTFTASRDSASAAHRADETANDAAQAPLELWRGLSPTQRKTYESVIRNAPRALQQPIADEVTALLKKGFEPTRPTAWIAGMVKKAHDGLFVLDAGLPLADARIARQRAATQAAEAPEAESAGQLSDENKQKLRAMTARLGGGRRGPGA